MLEGHEEEFGWKTAMVNEIWEEFCGVRIQYVASYGAGKVHVVLCWMRNLKNKNTSSILLVFAGK